LCCGVLNSLEGPPPSGAVPSLTASPRPIATRGWEGFWHAPDGGPAQPRAALLGLPLSRNKTHTHNRKQNPHPHREIDDATSGPSHHNRCGEQCPRANLWLRRALPEPERRLARFEASRSAKLGLGDVPIQKIDAAGFVFLRSPRPCSA